MKLKISALTIIFIFLSVIFISQTLFYYNNYQEKNVECANVPYYAFIDCSTYSSIYFDRFINGGAFSLVFISLTALSWKFDSLKKIK